MNKKSLLMTLCLGFSLPVSAGDKYPERYTIKWQERSDRIVLDSVCYTYAEGSIAYRRCRAQAQKYFIQQCRQLKAKYESTRAPYNQPYRKKRDMFCQAADRYYPL